MANLNFKWGNHESLAKLTTSEVGTLYFTKDEGGLYLGVNENEKPRRIQGVVQYYADLNAFKAEVLPPYSSDVIYYIASEGALVKWKEKKAASGDSAATSGEFVVLNVTASEFASAVANLSTDIAGNASDISDLRADLGERTGEEKPAFERIRALESAVDILEGLVSGTDGSSLSELLEDLKERMTTAEGDIDTLQSDVGNLQTDVAGLQSSVADHGTRLDAIDGDDGRLKALEGRMTTAEGDIDDLQAEDIQINGKIDGLTGRMGTAETNIGNLQIDVAGHTTAIGTLETNLGASDAQAGTGSAFARIKALEEASVEAGNGISGLADRMDDAEDAIEDHGTRLDAIDGANGELANIKTDIASLEANKANASDLTTLQGTVNGHTDRLNAIDGAGGAIETINNSIDELNDDIDDINAKIGDASNPAANTVYKAIADVANDVAGHETRLDDAEGRLDDAEDRLDSAESRLNQIDGEGGVLESLDSRVSDAESDIDDLTTRLNNIDGTNGELAKIKTDIAGHEDRLDTIEADYQTKALADEQHAALEGLIASEINAANALTYIGGVSSTSEWNTIKQSSAEIGSTYVVANALSLIINGTASTAVYPGDLLIATAKGDAKEDADGKLAADDIAWVHVKAGYNKELADELSVVSAEGGASVRLTSYPGAGSGNYGDLGDFTIVSDSKNIAISVDSSTNADIPAVKVSMVWDTF